jgi:DNA-binding NtrC family response regulator
MLLMCVVNTTILIVGAKERGEALRELPVRVILLDSGSEAVRCLRKESVDAIVSKWHLVDVPNGGLLDAVIGANPGIPTVAFVKSGDIQQEIAARSIGVTAVLSEDIDDDYFRDVMCQILHIEEVASITMKSEYESNEETNSLSSLQRSGLASDQDRPARV